MRYDETLAARLRKVHHIEILSRLQAEMASRDIDGLVIFRNDYFNWLNTHRSLMLDANLQGMAMIAVPQTGNPVGICSDHEYQAMTEIGALSYWRAYPMWSGIEYRYARQDQLPNFATQELADTPTGKMPSMLALQEVLQELGLSTGRIGVELSDLKCGVHAALCDVTAKIELVDSQPVLRSCAILKTDWDIYNLRFSAHHQWRVTHDVMMNILPGDSYADIRRQIEIGVASTPDIDENYFLMLYLGDRASGTARHFDLQIEKGDMVSVDLGFSTQGYMSDSGRAYVLGEATEFQEKVAEVYGGAHTIVKKMMVPGTRIGDLYTTARDLVRAAGISDFNRGHIGHSLGCLYHIEEYPFTLAAEDMTLQPNMIMTLEIPFYGIGFGAYFEEDIVLITEDGHESLTSAPFGLNVIPC
jgi:Xaa-Pro aminopeptidase